MYRQRHTLAAPPATPRPDPPQAGLSPDGHLLPSFPAETAAFGVVTGVGLIHPPPRPSSTASSTTPPGVTGGLGPPPPPSCAPAAVPFTGAEAFAAAAAAAAAVPPGVWPKPGTSRNECPRLSRSALLRALSACWAMSSCCTEMDMEDGQGSPSPPESSGSSMA